MVIDLFKKGTGMKCLKEIYQIDERTLRAIEDRAFRYETPPLSDEEIEETIETLRELPGNTKEKMIDFREVLRDRSRLTRWPVDDCVKIFLEETGIHPDTFDLSDVKVHCRHIAAIIDNGDLIRESGLCRLDELLDNPSPLSGFLLENGIVIKVAEHRILVDGNEYEISEEIEEFKILWSKLYHDLGEIEVFISGELNKAKGYSCISRCPEILYTLDDIFDKDLQGKWSERKTTLLLIEFDVDFDECIIHKMADYHDDIEPFFSREYEEEIPKLALMNYWVICQCLYNSSETIGMTEEYAAIRPEVRISPGRLTITVLNS